MSKKNILSFRFSLMTTMLQTSNIVWQTVNLTDELKINLEYDIHRGVLNIFVNNDNNINKLPYQINVVSENTDKCEFIPNCTYNYPELQEGLYR